MTDANRQLSRRTDSFLSNYSDRQEPPDGLAWHYTPRHSARNILSSGFLWASSVTHLKDRDEMIAGQRMIADRLEETFSRSGLSALVHRVSRGLRVRPATAPPKFLTFSASFSGSEDDPSQWKDYGRECGIAIGFDLNEVVRRNRDDFHILPIRCVYGKSRQRLLINEFVEWVAGVGSIDRRTATEVLYAAQYIATGFKRTKYEHENEWRLAVYPQTQAQVRQREGENEKVIPYIPLSLGGAGDSGSIHALMFGPGNDRGKEEFVRLARSWDLGQDQVTHSAHGCPGEPG